jgi:hypothetical protein
MWIHLLSLGLIDGAGGSPIPPTPTVQPAGGKGSTGRKRPGIVVLEIDGVEYRIPASELDAFLAARKKEVKKAAKRVIEDTPEIVEKPEIVAPIVVLESEEVPIKLIEQRVDEANKYYATVWDGVIRRQIHLNLKKRREEDELMVLLLS